MDQPIKFTTFSSRAESIFQPYQPAKLMDNKAACRIISNAGPVTLCGGGGDGMGDSGRAKAASLGARVHNKKILISNEIIVLCSRPQLE